MLAIGINEILQIKPSIMMGNKEVDAVYKGDQLVWKRLRNKIILDRPVSEYTSGNKPRYDYTYTMHADRPCVVVPNYPEFTFDVTDFNYMRLRGIAEADCSGGWLIQNNSYANIAFKSMVDVNYNGGNHQPYLFRASHAGYGEVQGHWIDHNSFPWCCDSPTIKEQGYAETVVDISDYSGTQTLVLVVNHDSSNEEAEGIINIGYIELFN